MHDSAKLLGVWLKGGPIMMNHPDIHFVNWLIDKGWDVQRKSGTDEYRAYPPTDGGVGGAQETPSQGDVSNPDAAIEPRAALPPVGEGNEDY